MNYDPKKDKWAPIEPMSIRKSGFATDSLDGKIFVFGGQHEGLQSLSINEILFQVIID